MTLFMDTGPTKPAHQMPTTNSTFTSAQQWMCEHALGITPASEEERPRLG